MGKPHEHAESSVKLFGGKPEDYLPIHQFLDSSGTTFGDVRHRALTHNSWFVKVVLPRVFGATIVNSEGKEVSVERIAEHHIMEDYPIGNFIPAVSDFLEAMTLEDWMRNIETGEVPPSRAKAPLEDKPKPAQVFDDDLDTVVIDPEEYDPDEEEPLIPGRRSPYYDIANRPCAGAGPGVMD